MELLSEWRRWGFNVVWSSLPNTQTSRDFLECRKMLQAGIEPVLIYNEVQCVYGKEMDFWN